MYALSAVLAVVAGVRQRHEERGATAVEYGLLVALIAAIIVGAVALLGERVSLGFDKVNSELPAS